MSDDAKFRKVGPRRPPQHTRWKKGQSGNPRGRPKDSLNVRTVLKEELEVVIALALPDGGQRQVPVLRALVKRAIHEGLRGNLQAIRDLLDRAERHGGAEPPATRELSDEDEAILRQVLGPTLSAPDEATKREDSGGEDD